MTDSAPAIRTADKDGEGPAKRRRRPALSCVECRNRKVRCDRGRPCRACTRVRSVTCTYRPERAGVRERSPAGFSASVNGGNEQDHRISARSSPQPTAPSNELGSTVNNHGAPGTSSEDGRSRPPPLPANQSSLSFNSNSNTGESVLIGTLLERIRSLENRNPVIEDQPVRTTLPIRQEACAGQFLKSKFYGESHWMHAIDPYEALGHNYTTVNQNTNRTEVNKKTELYTTVAKIKQMARIIKTSRLLQPSISQEIHNSIPPKGICDILAECYIRTFEAVFRVLHVPSFRAEYEAYWTAPGPKKPSFVLKMLLVCAIGVPFYNGSDQHLLRKACTKWIQAATYWLNGPNTKSRLNMTGLQIQILTLTARQVCNTDGDYSWISAGSLLRAAMHLGLHRDPAHFDKISLFHCEMRRRLWATILEITVQGSLDVGMRPMISGDDYDTKPPSNINDEEINEGNDTPLEEKPPTEFTECSIQIAFMETLPLRLEVVRLINNLRFDLPYEDVLRIGSELNDACRSQTIFLRSVLNSGCSLTPFQIKMADTLVRRFVLCLHRPYFAKAKDNPQYHYSRKICLDTSLVIYAPATELEPGQEDDWTKMTHRCVGFFKSFFLYAMSTVYIELMTQIKEQKHTSAIFTPMISTSTSQQIQSFTLPPQFQLLRNILLASHETTVARIRNGETNAKGAIFMRCAIARIDALVSGTDPDHAVLEAAKASVKETTQILADVYQAEHGVPIDLSVPVIGRNQACGDGADDITGRNLQTGTAVSVDETWVVSGDYRPTDIGSLNDAINEGVLDGSMGGLDMLGDGLDDLEGTGGLDAYMTGQSLDPMSWENHFARSPEWFYDMMGYAAPVAWGNGFGEM